MDDWRNWKFRYRLPHYLLALLTILIKFETLFLIITGLMWISVSGLKVFGVGIEFQWEMVILSTLLALIISPNKNER